MVCALSPTLKYCVYSSLDFPLVPSVLSFALRLSLTCIDPRSLTMSSSAIGPLTLFPSPRHVVLQKIQEISSTFPTASSGDPRIYTRGTSQIRHNGRLGHFPKKSAPFDWDLTGGTNLAVATDVNDGGGPRTTLLVRENKDGRFYAPGASDRTPERENGTESKCAPHWND